IPRRSSSFAASSPTPRTVETGAERIPLLGLDDERIVRLAAMSDLHLRALECRAKPVRGGFRVSLADAGPDVERGDTDALEPRTRILEDARRVGAARDQPPVEQRDRVARSDRDTVDRRVAGRPRDLDAMRVLDRSAHALEV